MLSKQFFCKIRYFSPFLSTRQAHPHTHTNTHTNTYTHTHTHTHTHIELLHHLTHLLFVPFGRVGVPIKNPGVSLVVHGTDLTKHLALLDFSQRKLKHVQM